MIFSRRVSSHDLFSQGQSLLEVIVASGVLVFVLVAVVSGMILSVRNSRFAQNQALATKYTQETIEMFRHFYSALGWEAFYQEFLNDSAVATFSYCLPTLITEPDPQVAAQEFQDLSPGPCPPTTYIPGTEFLREVSVIRGATVDDPIELEVRVSWIEGNTLLSSKSSVEFYKRYEN